MNNMKNIKLNMKITGEINTMEFNNYFKNKIEKNNLLLFKEKQKSKTGIIIFFL